MDKVLAKEWVGVRVCHLLLCAALYIIFDDFCHGISPLLNVQPCMFSVQWYDFFGLFPVKER